MVTRLWKGQKEMVTEPYFCGQVWNVERQLWDTVTKEYASEKDADIALNEYLEVHNAVLCVRRRRNADDAEVPRLREVLPAG